MHRTFRAGLLLAALCLLPAALCAQAPPSIKQVRIGLPAGRASEESGRSRNGSWAPVAVTLSAGAAGNPQDAYRLRIDTTDLDELEYQYTVPVPALAGNSERTVLGYIVPASDGVFRVKLETMDGRVVSLRDRISRDPTRDEQIGDQDVLFLCAGGGLAPFKGVAAKLDRAAEGKEPEPDRGRRQFAFADDAGALPDRWFGYDAVDVVILATGKADFVNQLAQDAERRQALLEWVRRGGQLVVSVGRNQQAVRGLLDRVPLIDCKITGSKPKVPTLPVLSQWAWDKAGGINRQPLRGVEMATFERGPGVHAVIRESAGPVMVEASCGLGRVVLVSFDLDMEPFTGWDGQDGFWTGLQDLVAPFLPRRGRNQGAPAPRPMPGMAGGPGGFGMPGADEYEFRTELKRSLETFEQVPVISFGWVALFILFYIALVGPLDYFLLKKVFKRLELTWVTFPVTVLAVSVVAYWVAYSVKGDDLRINKIDLVEVDLHAPNQAYGHSWFTLFSPRAQSYTVGIEPSTGTWTAPVPGRAPGPVVTLLEGGDRNPRTASQGLFRRPYEYAEDAVGLQRVPVPVWSTRSFTASWRAPLLEKKPPVGITDDVGPVRYARDGSGLVGRLTNHLPVVLRDVCLFHGRDWYALGDLAPEQSVRLDDERIGRVQKKGLNDWFTSQVLAPGAPLSLSRQSLPPQMYQRSSQGVIKPLLFFHASNSGGSNAGLRRLDQTWRLEALPEFPAPDRPRHRDELVLIARTNLVVDQAEVIAEAGASPTRLWLGELPAPDRERPPLRGVIIQETYLRVFIPVQRDR